MSEQRERELPHWQIWQQLPLHPRPAELGSLTSYITRVAQANGLQTSAELVAASGTADSWRTLCSFPDGSLKSVLGLTALTGCTPTDLEAMTLLPLSRQFGRANSTKTLRRFLQGSLASHLRYCPVCLAEHDFPYYRLAWRFLILSGCLTHHCQFLDHCGHCEAHLPHLSYHPQMAVCPTCGKDLRTCRPSPLEDGELRQLGRRTSDLIFLLSSPVQSQEEDPRVTVGQRYSFLRQQRGLSLQEVSSQTSLNLKLLLEIESPGPYKQETFLDYLQYADLLDYCLEELFALSSSLTPLNEDTLLAHIDEVLQEWQVLGRSPQDLRRHSLSKGVGVHLTTLRKYPRTNSRLTAWYTHRSYVLAREKQQREEELVQLVMNAIQQLETLKQSVTQQRIAQMVGMTYQSLRRYPRVEALLMQVASKHPSSKPQSYLVSVQKRLLPSTNTPGERAAE